MFNRDWRADKTALWVRVVTAVSVVASLGLAAGESPAATRPSVRAQIQDGILQITGTPRADKVALGLKPANPNALDVDVGDDGTVDFSFDRGTLGRSPSRATRATSPWTSARSRPPTSTPPAAPTRSPSTISLFGLAPQIQIAGSEPANDTLNINTLAGNDTASVTSGVSSLIQPIINLGADE